MRTVRAGGTVVKDPNAEEVFQFDWGTEHLAASVQIASSQFFISGVDGVLVKDNEGILPLNRSTQLRLRAGTLDVKYTVTNRIVTNEVVPQTKDASFKVLIKER
jgi:hypothetical protein